MLPFSFVSLDEGTARRGAPTLSLWFTLAVALVLRLLCLPLSFLSSAFGRRGDNGPDQRASLKALSPRPNALGSFVLRMAHFLRALVAVLFSRLANAFSPVVSALSPSGSVRRMRSGALGALFCLLLLAPVTSWAADGDVDTSFGNGLAGASNTVYAVAVQGDGKVLIGGFFTSVNGTTRGRIARLNSDGSVDTSFGNGLAGASSFVYAVAVQGDGKVLIGGQFTSVNGTTRGNIARLNSDGSLDTSFGNGLNGASSTVQAVAVQGDGKVLIGGSFTSVNGTTRGRIARLNSDGSLDTSFGNGLTGASGTVQAVAVQGDGKVLIGGSFTSVNGTTRGNIARLNSDGSLDTSFGNGLTGTSSTVQAVAVQGDGKVLIGGQFSTVNGTTRFRIARLNSDGSVDTSFGNGLAGANGIVNAVAVQGDGKVLIGGSFTSVNGTTRIRIARLNSDGSVDTSFGNGLTGTNNSVRAAAVQGDGKALIGGDFTTVNGTNRGYIARLASTPTITSFAPTSGPVGTSVVITGTSFTGATNVSFNGTSATTYTIDSDTQITATVPTGATTGTIIVTVAGVTATSTGTFTVLSSVSVAVSPASVLEDSGPPLVYTFTRSGALDTAITVNFTVTGTATYGNDYTQSGAASFTTTTGTVTFAANATTATVNLLPTADSTNEPDETTILTLAAGTGYSAVAPTSATGTIQNDDFMPVATSGALIGEFRAHGSGGANDEYIELANSTTSPLSIGGWQVKYLSGGSLVTATVPANTTLPAMGHYLFTGSGYNATLLGISGSDQTLANPMDDATGITLLNAASTVVDAVSFVGSSMAGEGTLLPSAPTANGEYAFERRQSSGNPAGVPLDNNNNSGDFIFVSTTGAAFASVTGDGTATTLDSTLGSPSPNSTTGYVQTGSVAMSLLDTSVANSVAPNRVRLNAVDSGVTGAPDRFGTLRLRRTLTNNGGTTYTRVRFHVVTITTYSAGGLGGYSDLNQADVRLLTSPDETGIATSTGAKNVIGTSVQAPATGTVGGGLNANTVVLNQALTPGSSANYSFELGVARKGNFLVGFTIELLP